MVILYESLTDGYFWDGTLKEAETHWSTNPPVPHGCYIITIDFAEVPDYLFWLVKLNRDLEFSIRKWLDKGLVDWEWKDKTLILNTVEESPYIQFIILGVIAAIIIIIAFIYADKILVTVKEIVEEVGISGKVFIGGLGIAAAAVGVGLLIHQTRKPKGKS